METTTTSTRIGLIKTRIKALKDEQLALQKELIQLLRREHPMVFQVEERGTPTTPKWMGRGSYVKRYGCFDNQKDAFATLANFAKHSNTGYKMEYSVQSCLVTSITDGELLMMNVPVFPSDAEK